jgi:IS1 family transposase
LDFGTLGLPIFGFINTLRKTKIIVDGIYFPFYSKSTIKNAMANNLPFEKKVNVIAMLAEGSSIRAIERVTGVNRNTIMNLGVRVGHGCARMQDAKMRNIQSSEIQIDEIWGFVGKKRNKAQAWDRLEGIGDIWTFIALDRDTKLIPTWLVGQRTMQHAEIFLRDLRNRLAGRIQLSSDALPAYREMVGKVFGENVDYGQVVKTLSVSHLGSFKEAATRYSPAQVVKTEKSSIIGEPDFAAISTSHIEKQNHTLRMHCRRLTRLTNAFSKKLENFQAAVALNFAYYNFCKRHITVKTTPAVAAGVENHEWTVTELVESCGE